MHSHASLLITDPWLVKKCPHRGPNTPNNDHGEWIMWCTCSSALLAVAEGRGADRPQTEALRSLLTCRVACLVGMPQLLTVVTKLGAAALPAARDLGTAGTAEGDDCVPGEDKHIRPELGHNTTKWHGRMRLLLMFQVHRKNRDSCLQGNVEKNRTEHRRIKARNVSSTRKWCT